MSQSSAICPPPGVPGRQHAGGRGGHRAAGLLGLIAVPGRKQCFCWLSGKGHGGTRSSHGLVPNRETALVAESPTASLRC